jgi:hypothetical protein
MDALEYSRLAEMNKPQTPEGIVAAARELLHNGSTEFDVAHVLKVDVHQIRRLVGECPSCE